MSSGQCENFTRIGFFRTLGWNLTMSPSVHSDSTKVRGIKDGGDLEERDESASEREIPARIEQSVLG